MKKLIIAVVLTFLYFKNITNNSYIQLLPIFLLMVVIFENVILVRNSYGIFDKKFLLLHSFVLIVLVGIVKSNNPTTSINYSIFKFLSFFTFIVAYFGFLNYRIKKIDYLKLFIYLIHIPLFLYISINLCFWAIGLTSSGYDIGRAVMLGKLGFNISRVGFIFANGINAYGAILGLFLVISIILLMNKVKLKKYLFFSCFIAILSLLLTDSRAALIYSIFIFFVIKIVEKRKKVPKITWLIPFLGFIGPILILSLLSFIATTSYGELLSRGSGDLESGNSRAIIWFFAFNEFVTFKPILHILGYGEFGHFASGASQYWEQIFNHMEEGSDLIHPHNTFLSIAFDYGYLGLIVFTSIQLFVVKFISYFWKINRIIACVFLANLLYINMTGITETMFGFYYKNVIELFFMFHVFAFVIWYDFRKKKSDKTFVDK